MTDNYIDACREQDGFGAEGDRTSAVQQPYAQPWQFTLDELTSDEYRADMGALRKMRLERDLAELQPWTIVTVDGNPFSFLGTLTALKDDVARFFPDLTQLDCWYSAVRALVHENYIVLRRDGQMTGPGGLAGSPYAPADIRTWPQTK